MEDEDGYFGEHVAATYDGTSGVFAPGAVEATAEVLAELACGGRALELGIGTGRVFNTIMNLTSQDAQVACFGNAAAHLEPGGCFVIECRVPELRRLPPGQDVLPWNLSPERWVSYSYDTATQAMNGHYAEFTGGRGEYSTMPFRYVWPAELDLMAQLAGMRLRDRWEGWTRQPFTSQSAQHVSVWEKPPA